jgi:hypothetical protein
MYKVVFARGTPLSVEALSAQICGLLVMLILAAAARAEEPEITTNTQKDYVSDVFPYNIDDVYDHIELLFNSDAREFYEDYPGIIYDLPDHVANAKNLSPELYEEFLKFPLVRANKFYVFFGAYENTQHVIEDMTPLAAIGHDNAALQRYAALPPEARAQDVYLWSPDVPYWHSEYTLHGKPLPFRTYFIMHLTPVDESHTTVEVIEDQPVVRMGQKLSVDEHGTVHHFDVREVEPTTSDREFLVSCVRQFMDRKVPGRHWFNCRDSNTPEPEAPVPFTVP